MIWIPAGASSGTPYNRPRCERRYRSRLNTHAALAVEGVHVNVVREQDHFRVPAGQAALVWLCAYRLVLPLVMALSFVGLPSPVQSANCP
jgi:hypothetical protein